MASKFYNLGHSFAIRLHRESSGFISTFVTQPPRPTHCSPLPRVFLHIGSFSRRGGATGHSNPSDPILIDKQLKGKPGERIPRVREPFPANLADVPPHHTAPHRRGALRGRNFYIKNQNRNTNYYIVCFS